MDESSIREWFDAVPVGLYRTTPSGQILEANPAMARMLGYPDVESLKSLNAVDLYAERKDREAWMGLIKRDWEVKNFEVRWRHMDGTPIWVKNSTRATKGVDDEILFFDGVVEDISESRQLKSLSLSSLTEELREADIPYLSLLDQLPIFAVRKDLSGRIIYANPHYCRREIDRPLQEIIGKYDYDFYESQLAAKYHADDLRVVSSGQVYETIEEHQKIGGKVFFFHVVKAPIRNAKGKITGVQCLFWDINDHKRAMVALHQILGQASLYRNLFEKTFSVVVEFDRSFRISRQNAEADTLFGALDTGKIVFLSDLILPDVLPNVQETSLRLLTTESPAEVMAPCEVEVNGKLGKLSLEIVLRAIQINGVRTSIRCYARDITPRKNAEADRLKEIHHRIKNNLQVVANLLNLEADTLRDEKIKSILAACEYRVQTMALIHKLLYQSSDMAKIDFPQYLKSLCNYLKKSYPSSNQSISIKLQFDDNIHFGLDTAVPCALVVNELVSNALKHAFPSGRRGEIRILLHKEGSGAYRLHIGDNGIGIPRDLYIRDSPSLGMRLVFGTIEQQLGGTIELVRSYGTAFNIRFKESHVD